ncbi:MAG: thiamine phosphate synthase [Candidatus Omnitrophica bacterium]|nr:thiamine phosphate synthase [Candidatus Omnitrophota bacterium]
MKLKKSLLKTSRLYLILDRSTIGNCSLKNICSIVSSRYVDVVQLRDKKSAKSDVLDLAIKLSKWLKNRPQSRGLATDSQSQLFIVNDYVDVAVASGADGLHLGQNDLSLKQARKILGKDRIIGISCHNLSQALRAQNEGADYLGIGPIFATATKPEYKPIGLEVLGKLKDKIKIPYFAIGDIHAGNIKEITASGARRVAVCRAILKADNPKEAVRQLYKILK